MLNGVLVNGHFWRNQRVLPERKIGKYFYLLFFTSILTFYEELFQIEERKLDKNIFSSTEIQRVYLKASLDLLSQRQKKKGIFEIYFKNCQYLH